MLLQTFEEIVTPELAEGAIINTRHPGFKEDYLVIHSLIRKYKPASLFEIGTNTGFGTKIIKNAMVEGRVISMDLPIDEFRKIQKYPPMPGLECDLPFTQVYGDSLSFDYSSIPCEAYFVDGAHDYRHVFYEASEILKLQPRLIIFHDADIPEVMQAIFEAYMEHEWGYLLYKVDFTRIAYIVKRDL